jgi:hypothetical protein
MSETRFLARKVRVLCRGNAQSAPVRGARLDGTSSGVAELPLMSSVSESDEQESDEQPDIGVARAG